MGSKWTMQITAPNGQVFEMGEMGYASSTQEHSYIMSEIRYFLENSTLTQREFLLADLHQMLLNSSLMRFHGYRLVWGDSSPNDAHVAYPNGKDTKWTLYRLINGQTRVLLQGELPSDWWDLNDHDRRRLVEDRVQEEAYRPLAV